MWASVFEQFEKEKEVDERLRLLRSQQDELAYKERDLNIEKSQIEKEKLNIINEKIHIASQQQTLRVAWENIRKLQANK